MADGGVEQVHDGDDDVGRRESGATHVDRKQVTTIAEGKQARDQTKAMNEVKELQVFSVGYQGVGVIKRTCIALVWPCCDILELRVV